jgi:hypothetical protein
VIVARSDADGERSPGAINQERQLRPYEPMLPRVAGLLLKLLAGDQGAVGADQRAIQVLTLDEDV